MILKELVLHNVGTFAGRRSINLTPKSASSPIVLIGGLVVTETVFNLPGVARYLVDAIQFRDYPVVQNLVMFIAIVVVLANLTVDLLYAWVDPRIKYGKA